MTKASGQISLVLPIEAGTSDLFVVRMCVCEGMNGKGGTGMVWLYREGGEEGRLLEVTLNNEDKNLPPHQIIRLSYFFNDILQGTLHLFSPMFTMFDMLKRMRVEGGDKD